MHTITTYGGSWVEGNSSLNYTFDTMNSARLQEIPEPKPEVPDSPAKTPEPKPEVPAEKPKTHPDEPTDNKCKSKFVGVAKKLIEKGYDWKDLHQVLKRRLKRENSLVKKVYFLTSTGWLMAEAGALLVA
jgi:hypothetical protein